MEPIRITEFLHSTGYKYTDEGLNHYMNILIIIKNKLFNPDMPECNFVELVVSEQWDKAYWAADTRNREAFGINLFQNFNSNIIKHFELQYYVIMYKLQFLL